MQLILPVIGAVIGSFFGEPGMGWMAGSMLSSLLFPGELPAQFGPRLGDLKVQTSTYGLAIPCVYGTVRIAGNVFWAPNLVEHATTQTAGGKGGGGPTQEVTTYTYSGSFAVALCEGPIIGVRKLWANGKVIFDVGDSSSLLSVIASNNVVTIYNGSEAQTADPVIAADIGAALTPGYRGTAYLVFNYMLLTDYGNRLPNIEAEVVASGTVEVLVPHPLYTYPGTQSLFTQSLALDYAVKVMPGGSETWTVVSVGDLPLRLVLVDNYTGDEIARHDSATQLKLVGEVSFMDRQWFDEADGHICCLDKTGTVNLRFTDQGLSGSDMRIADLYEYGDDSDGQEHYPMLYVVHNPTGIGRKFFRMNTAAGTHSELPATGSRGFIQFIQHANRQAARLYLYQYYADPTILGYIVPTDTVEFTWSFTTIRTYNMANVLYAFFGNDGYIYAKSANANEANIIEKLTPDGLLVGSCTLPGVSATAYTSECRFAQDLNGNLIVQFGQVNTYRILHGTMELDASSTMPSTHDYILPGDTFDGAAVYTARDSVPGSPGPNNSDTMRVIAGDRIAITPPTVGSVVLDRFARCGLSAADIDVSLLTMTVDGYVIPRRASVRTGLDPLLQAFFIDAVESDNKVKFVPRGAAPVVTIPDDDLAAHTGATDELPDPLNIVRRQEMDLPCEINVAYMDKAMDYQVVQQPSRRLVTSAASKLTLQLAIVMTNDKAKQIADATMYSMWTQRQAFTFATTRKYLAYEPCDVMTVKGNTLRITQKDEGADGLIQWQGVAEDASVYTQSGIGAQSSAGIQEGSIIGTTVADYLDIPLLRDADNDGGFYYAARGRADGWNGSQLYQSVDAGTTYAALSNGINLVESGTGYALTVLATTDVTEMMDEGSSVDVKMFGETPVSITQAQVLAGAGGWLIGAEVLQVRTATQLTADTWRLTGLLRGRLGTEQYMATHAVGDVVVMLDENIRSIELTNAQINKSYLYKPLSIGRSLAQTPASSFRSTGVRLKPLSPIAVGGGKDSSGNWTITWKRRTRFAAQWADYSDAPLGEAQEKYYVDIAHAGATVRRITTTTPTATYSAADQVTDFGSLRGTISITVYQVSDAVGLGYPTVALLGDVQPSYYWAIGNITVPGGGYLQLTELQLLDVVVGNVFTAAARDGTDDKKAVFTVPGYAGTGRASTVFLGAGHWWNWFDGDLITNAPWLAESDAENPTQFFIFDFSAVAKLSITGIKQAPDSAGINRYMQGFSLWRSNTGTGTPYTSPTDWILVGTKSGLTEPAPNTLSAEYGF